MKASLTSPWLVAPSAKIADHCHVAIGVTSTDEPVAFHRHGVARLHAASAPQ
jgi:hypothetical protein